MVEKILRATHQGKLTIGDKQLNCAVLDDNTRIISRNAIFRAFGRTKRGRSKEEKREPNMPSFIDAKNLKPFIDDDLRGELKLIPYISLTGRMVSGYKAEVLPMLCNVYLKAVPKLNKQQLPLVEASRILINSFSKLGIVALIDEATGFQYDRDKDDLQKILSLYVAEELLPWAKTFPDEFYKQLFRLRGWSYNPLDVKRPRLVGKITNKIIYDKLPDGVLEKLKTHTPKSKAGNYTKRFFQHLTPDIGNPHLEKQLVAVITLMKISPNWRVFEGHFARAFGGQMLLDFQEETN